MLCGSFHNFQWAVLVRGVGSIELHNKFAKQFVSISSALFQMPLMGSNFYSWIRLQSGHLLRQQIIQAGTLCYTAGLSGALRKCFSVERKLREEQYRARQIERAARNRLWKRPALSWN